jgi:ankyrin repeat protein
MQRLQVVNGRLLAHSVLKIAVLSLSSVLWVNSCGAERDISDQMIIAARSNDIRKVRELIERGADVNAKENVTGEGDTALFHAAAAGYTEVAKVLIEKGAKLNGPAGSMTPLIMAASGGHADTVEVLIKTGANVNAKDDQGHTALTDAARKNHFEVVKLLIENGAEPNVTLPDGNTPLSWAKANNNSDMVKLLRKAGASKP